MLIEQTLAALEGLMSSPWIYPALALMAFVDSLFPLFPSEAAVILSSAYAASEGTPHPVGIFLAAVAGAWVGDHVTYFAGRGLAGRVDTWPAESRRGRAVRAARGLLARRGGMALVAARFIPWARIATSLVMGATRYPLRSYTAYDTLGVCVWALHGCLLGYLGGVAFQDEPLKAMALGLAMAILASVAVELVRWRWGRRRGRSVADAEEAGSPIEQMR